MCNHGRATPRVAPLDRLQAALYQRGLIFRDRSLDSFVVSRDLTGWARIDPANRLRVELVRAAGGERFVWGERGEFSHCACEPGAAARRIDEHLHQRHI